MAEPHIAASPAGRASTATESTSLVKAATDQASASVRAGLEEAKAHVRAGTEAVRDGLASAAEQAKEQAAEIGAQAKQRAYDIAEEQKQVGADGIDSVARAVRLAADELEETAPALARYVHDAASGIDRVSTDLKRKSVDDLIGTVEHFARAQPVAFFGGAVLGGFLLARFIKSSAERRSGDQEMRSAPAGDAHQFAEGQRGRGQSGPNPGTPMGGFGPAPSSRAPYNRSGDPAASGASANAVEKPSGGSATSRGVGMASDLTGGSSPSGASPASTDRSSPTTGGEKQPW